MFQCLLLWALLGTISGNELNYAVHNDRRTNRVIGGQEAKRNSWESQVSLQIAYDDDPEYFYHMCGGSLISRNWVLTAAHCVGFEGVIYRVGLGEHNLFELDGTEYFITVNNIVIHKDWDPNDIVNGFDIALLHLSSSAFDNGFVAMAQLPSKEHTLSNGHPCYVTGWGATDALGSLPDTLQEALLPVVDQAVCSQDQWWGDYAKDNMVCAGGDGLRAGCSGDSGGPLSCRVDGIWQVHGIVSYGLVPECNTFEKPTVFTRVSAFVDWIYETFEMHGGQ